MATFEKHMLVATLNVRGLASRRRQNQLFRLITEKDLDIVAVQETKIESQEQTDSMVRLFTSRYDVCVCHAVGKSAGCVLMIRRILGAVVENVVTCNLGHFIVCDITLFERNWRIICVYAYTNAEQRKEMFEAISNYCVTDRFVIVIGDFNCVCMANDKTSSTPYRDVSVVSLNNIISQHCLEDVGECCGFGNDIRFTHFQGQSHARLDRAYLSADLVPLIGEYRVQPVSFSDHCLVTFRVGKRKDKTCKFVWENWKLNDKLLKDDVFIRYVTNAIAKFDKGYYKKVGEHWELFKQEVKMKAIERSGAIKHKQESVEKVLRANLGTFISEECRQPGTFTEDISTIKQKLELIDREKYEGAVVRARSERLMGGEFPTKRALGLEKSRAHLNEIAKVEWKNAVITDKEGIQRAFYEYYSALYSCIEVDVDTFKNKFLTLMPRVSDETKENLEMPISLEEVKKAINDLNPGKSPGPDGLTASLYKVLREKVAVVLVSLFNEAFDMSVLPPSFRTSNTVLIPKVKDKNKLMQVTSYRPISLTNIDYKIFMKILAKRLQTVIQELVGEHQTCGIKGRSIVTNIHKARSVLECCDANSDSIAMLQLDLEKAFDRVPHDILLAILQHVNVGSVLREGVAMAYRGCTTRLIVNKVVGARIKVERSVRQGCPLSPLLFSMYIESFCLSIINSSTIRGFRLHAAEVRLLAYADDIALFCADHESIINAVKVVKDFCEVSGSAINWGKCLGFWHGNWPTTPNMFCNVRWDTTPAPYLGVPLENYKDSEPLWRRKVVEVREKADNLKSFYWSIFARATMCNLFLIGKLWYIMQVIHCSRVNVQKLHRVLAVFIWGSTWERTRRTNLFRRVRYGGLSLSHLYIRQLVNRFMFFRDVPDPFLRTVCQVRLGRVLPNFVVTSESMPGGLGGYLKEVYLSCIFLQARFSLDYLWTVSRKKLYKDLCDIVLPVPLYRSQCCAGPWANVLKRVKSMSVPGGVKTFFFKLHTNTLDVKTYLEEKGFFVPWGTHCFICRKPETIEHVFLDCREAFFFWDILQRTLKKDLPVDSFGIRFLPVEHEDGIPFDLIMLLGLHSIWRSRMAVRNADIDAKPIRLYFKESINRIITVYQFQTPEPEWLPRVGALLNMPEY